MKQDRKYAHIKIEVSEVDRDRIFFDQGLLRDGQELPPGKRSHERRNADHGGEGPEIGRGEHQEHALVQIPRARFARTLSDFMSSRDRGLSLTPDQDDQSGANQDEEPHAQQHTFRAETFGHRLGEVAGKDSPRNPASSHHAEDALRLPCGEDVIRQGPDLGRSQNPKNLHPDVERRIEPKKAGVEVGQHPEDRAVAGK